MSETPARDQRPEVGGAKVVLFGPEGRPSFGTIRHPEDAGTPASFYTKEDGSLVLTITGAEGRLHLEDGEGPAQRRLARVMMALKARGFFSPTEHQEGLSVLWGTALENLSTDGASAAGSVVLKLMAPVLAP